MEKHCKKPHLSLSDLYKVHSCRQYSAWGAIVTFATILSSKIHVTLTPPFYEIPESARRSLPTRFHIHLSHQ